METILKIVLTAGFTIFGLGKLLPIPMVAGMTKDTFKQFGLDDRLRRLTGAGELLGAALLWLGLLDDNVMFGAVTLALISVLATSFHTKFKDWKNLPPALIMTLLSIWLFVMQT